MIIYMHANHLKVSEVLSTDYHESNSTECEVLGDFSMWSMFTVCCSVLDPCSFFDFFEKCCKKMKHVPLEYIL